MFKPACVFSSQSGQSMPNSMPKESALQSKVRLPRFLAKLPIAYKLAFLLALLISSSMILLGLIITHNHSQLIDQQYLEFGQTVAKQMAESAKDSLLSNDPLALEVIANNLLSEESILGVALYSDQGNVLTLAGITPPSYLAEKALKGQSKVEWELYSDNNRVEKYTSFMAPAVFKSVNVGYGLITLNQSKLRQAKIHILQALAVTSVVLLIFGVLISLYLGRRITRPISNMAKASAAIDHGELENPQVAMHTDEVGQLWVSVNNMQEGMRQKVVLEESFSRYVSPSLAKSVIHDPQLKKLGGRYVDASVLFADIVGFTSLSERMPPDELSELLNDYFSYISTVAHFFQGHVDKYIGDCAMLVFGAPEQDVQHRYHAIGCAVVTQQLIALVNQHRKRQGMRTLHFHIGVNSGRMLAGNMGSPERMNYTVIGDTVNLASRLASEARSDQIVITQQLLDELAASEHFPTVTPHGALNLRGKQLPVETYLVTDIDNAREQSYQLFKQTLASDEGR